MAGRSDAGLGVFGVESSRKHNAKHKAIQMNKHRSSKSNRGHSQENCHNQQPTVSSSRPRLEVCKVRDDEKHYHTNIRSEHSAKAQSSALNGEYGETISSPPRQQAQRNRPPPRVFHLVHDECCENHVAQNVNVVVVQKNCSYRLIHVYSVAFDELDIEQPFVHLFGPSQELSIAARLVHDVHDNKHDNVQDYQRARHACHLKVGHES